MWYTGNDRVQPGQVGTAVIAGHVVNRGSGDAFANLAKVSVGDRIELGGSSGGTYRVVRAGIVDKQALTTDQTVWGTTPPYVAWRSSPATMPTGSAATATGWPTMS